MYFYLKELKNKESISLKIIEQYVDDFQFT